jgi:Zn finger protein HypA/HybF involved in hydrogenase expression
LPLVNSNSNRREEMEAYCVKCKAKREMADAQEVTMKNGRKAMKGKCPVCGTGMYRIMGKA